MKMNEYRAFGRDNGHIVLNNSHGKMVWVRESELADLWNEKDGVYTRKTAEEVPPLEVDAAEAEPEMESKTPRRSRRDVTAE